LAGFLSLFLALGPVSILFTLPIQAHPGFCRFTVGFDTATRSLDGHAKPLVLVVAGWGAMLNIISRWVIRVYYAPFVIIGTAPYAIKLLPFHSAGKTKPGQRTLRANALGECHTSRVFIEEQV
jgi:hypothetical protein